MTLKWPLNQYLFMWSSYMIIYDHHIWSSYMIIICDHYIWSSYMIITYDDHIWWSCMFILEDDHIKHDHFRFMLGSCKSRFRVMFGCSSWDHFGVVSDSFWGHFEIIKKAMKATINHLFLKLFTPACRAKFDWKGSDFINLMNQLYIESFSPRIWKYMIF